MSISSHDQTLLHNLITDLQQTTIKIVQQRVQLCQHHQQINYAQLALCLPYDDLSQFQALQHDLKVHGIDFQCYPHIQQALRQHQLTGQGIFQILVDHPTFNLNCPQQDPQAYQQFLQTLDTILVSHKPITKGTLV